MKGFTLLEVLIVVGILILLSSMVIFSFFGQQQKAALGSEVENMTIRLRQAQAKAVSMEDDSKWGIHFENPAVGDDFYALFSGDAYVTPAEKYFLPGGVQFDNPSTGNSFDVVFNKLKGNCIAPSSVIISLTATPLMTKTISVNSEGKIATEIAAGSKVNGESCLLGIDCSSGNCANSVCCNTACIGSTCQRCDSYSNAGAGTCGYISSAVDPDNECETSGCYTGYCKGDNYGCAYYTEGQHNCSSGYVCNSSGSCVLQDLPVINIAAIPGVTPPVTGATPVATITETAQYTGTVTWSPVANPFAGSTVYTATITLTPKTGYTLTGVAANFFTVAGATTDTNPINSGVVTAVFPATAAFACGDSVTFNYNGSPVTYGTVSSSGKCWMDRNLGASQVATAYSDYLAYGDLFQWGRKDDNHQSRTCTGPTTCTPTYGTVEGDMTLTGQPGNNLFITEQTSPYDWANNAWISRWTVAEDDPCPEGWRVPTNTELSTEEASWALQNYNGAFASPLKLTAGGYRYDINGSLYNVGTNGFYWSSAVNGSNAWSLFFYSGDSYMSSGHRAKGFSVRCLQDLPTINIAAIPGVTPPVTGATPVATITETAQYTGTVAWSPVASPFAGSTVYTATITLTPKTGYTLTGVAANFFTVAGATTDTNPINSGVVTAVFPATDFGHEQ